MKKMTFLACAAMLTSAIALNSCKSDDPIGKQYDGEVVKTEFAISLPDDVVGGGAKHMPSTTVQRQTSEFQGITGIMLVPFAKAGAIAGTDTRLGNNIYLDGNVESTDMEKTCKAKVYSNVAIPLTTSAFLFYGKSAKTGSKFQVGSIVIPAADTASANPQDYKFMLDTILPMANYNTMMSSGHGASLMTYLTTITAATDAEAPNPQKMWRQYNSSMSGDSASFGAMFETYITLKDLSSFQVERMLSDLYRSLKPRRASSVLADHIMDAIENGTYATISNDSVKLVEALKKFPQEYRIPEGCVSTKWNGTDAFIKGDYTDKAHPSTFVYPAQLWYYVNSTIKTSNTSQADIYDNLHTWPQILEAYTGAAAVNSLTRSVAIKDTVNYAVARLDVAVKIDNTNAGKLDDRSYEAEGIAKQVDCAAGFPVTAVLIGNQRHVGFDFAPLGDNVCTIYDSLMTNSMTAGLDDYNLTTNSNSTLVLESPATGNHSKDDVMIAIEMVNTIKDFYGINNQLIPKGSKFYVCAKLATGAQTGSDKTAGHVFKKDFKTTAKLKLTTLRNAYNTIPDLRTPQLEVGFTVDLNWQNGNEYEIEI